MTLTWRCELGLLSGPMGRLFMYARGCQEVATYEWPFAKIGVCAKHASELIALGYELTLLSDETDQ
jgi:hypothetical protein